MRKTIIRFFTIADYEEEEIWLRQQHNKGWKIVRMILPCFYIFESCQPEDVVYRLDYKNHEQTADYMQMVDDFGWEYIGRCAGWLYFRKPALETDAPEDRELFSDTISRIDMVSHVVRTRLVPLAIIFLCCVIPNFIRYVFADNPNGASIFLGVLFGILFVIYVFLIVYCGIKLKKIRDKYQY